MGTKIDLNCDCGESFGNYVLGLDEQIMDYVSSINVACGFHASDPLTMQKTVKTAAKKNIGVGAHPGYPDLTGFGRRNMDIAPKELKAIVQYQIGALTAFCRAEKIPLSHVKPHGAMYNMAAKDEKLAFAIAEAIGETDSGLILLGLSGSKLLDAGKKAGIKTKSEVFADRNYMDDGTLVPRTRGDALIKSSSDAIKQVITIIKTGTVISVTGKEIPLEPDSVCVHGDTPQALEFVKEISTELERNGIKIQKLS